MSQFEILEIQELLHMLSVKQYNNVPMSEVIGMIKQCN